MQVALEMIEDRGFDALRIQGLADRAGVSTGTVHYYFEDLDGLLTDVHALAAERFIAHRMKAIARHDDARARMAEMIRAALPASPDDAITVALYSIDSVKRADPVRAQLGSRLYDQQVLMYLGILELGVGQGHFTVAYPVLDIAQNLVGLEDAYCMHIIERNSSLPPKRCLELMFSHARSATGCLEIGREV